MTKIECLSCWERRKWRWRRLSQRYPLHWCAYLGPWHLRIQISDDILRAARAHLGSGLFSKRQSPLTSCSTQHKNYFYHRRVNPASFQNHNYSIWDCVHTWGAVSITNWSRFSIFFTSSWWVDISVSAVWTTLNQTQKSGFTSSSHLTDLTIPASIISHPATLSRTLWKVPRIFERRPRCDQEEQSLGKYFVFVTEDTRRMAAAQ